MAVVRIIDLKDSSGNLLLASEDDFYLPVKTSILYWNEKTKDFNDENFLLWIQEQNKKGTLIYEDDCNGLKQYLSLTDFSLITDDQLKLFFGYASMMDFLIDANSLNIKK